MKDKIFQFLAIATCVCSILAFCFGAFVVGRVLYLGDRVIWLEKRVETECQVKP